MNTESKKIGIQWVVKYWSVSMLMVIKIWGARSDRRSLPTPFWRLKKTGGYNHKENNKSANRYGGCNNSFNRHRSAPRIVWQRYSTPIFKSIIGVLIIPSALIISTAANSSPSEIPFWSCFQEAGARYSIEPALLAALADTESSFRPDAMNIRSNTDKDIGIMQIWSNWLPDLERYNIGENELLDPCVNINVGAWILAQNFASHGMTMTSLGAYNAGFRARNEEKRMVYVEKVLPKLYHYRGLVEMRILNDKQ